MMKTLCGRWMAMVLVASSGFAMMAVTFDAQAKRFGGGFSSGRQSVNVMQQRQAVTPPATTAARAAGTAGAAGATTGARWLGPLAGIAAGLGIAALLSHFGLGGAMADLLVLALMAGIALFAIRFILKALSNGLNPAAQAANITGMQRRRQEQESAGVSVRGPMSGATTGPLSGLLGAGTMNVEPPKPSVGDWFIPADFDQDSFLTEAKSQFIAIQKAWDTVDFDGLQSRLTEELYAEYAGKMAAHGGRNRTEVVRLDADLMGIEKLINGHMASVRFSGLIREDDNAKAAAFEEAWNLYKPDGKGWLLAGVQQLSSS